MRPLFCSPGGKFLSTPSARRATYTVINEMEVFLYFYPRPPRGGRPTIFGSFWSASGFLSTPSARRATAIGAAVIAKVVQISIHALREEGDRGMSKRKYLDAISIHALREEGDPDAHSPWQAVCGISIHALREEGDRPSGISCWISRTDFYPRPPRGGRRWGVDIHQAVLLISIHALREEGDQMVYGRVINVVDFYPRPPRGGRLNFTITQPEKSGISIHALREEGDHLHFRPRRGVRLFLSTPSARRATCTVGSQPPGKIAISIHALREEGDTFRMMRTRCYC